MPDETIFGAGSLRNIAVVHWEGHSHMMMESSNRQAVCHSQARKVATVEEGEPRGVPLEAGEFDRLLQRAAEVLKVRQGAA